MDAACAAAGYKLMENGLYPPRGVAKMREGVVLEIMTDSSLPRIWRDRLAITEASEVRKKQVREAAQVPAGTSLLMEKAFEQACKPPKNALPRKPGSPFRERPRFKSWDQTGRIGVQMKRDSAKSVFDGTSSNLKIGPRAIPHGRGGQPRPDRLQVHLRCGPGKEVIILPCVIHRMPPEDAVVTGAWIRVIREGAKFRFQLQLVLESDEFEVVQENPNLPTVAVDLGWRRLSDGRVRVAYWADSEGKHGEVAVPAVVASGLAHCSPLEGFRSSHHNRALSLAKVWVKSQRASFPEPVQKHVQAIHAWKSPARLSRLSGMLSFDPAKAESVRIAWSRWREERLRNKLDLFASYTTVRKWDDGRSGIDPFILYFEFWRQKNRHLFTWTECSRRKVLGHRDQIFREVAKRMSHDYGKIVFENLDLRGFARDALPDEEDGPDRHHRTRNIASPGRFRSLISVKSMKKMKDEEMHNSTRECHSCHHVNEATPSLMMTCAKCKAVWDQDHNAAINLLWRCENRNSLTPAVRARKPTRRKLRPSSVAA